MPKLSSSAQYFLLLGLALVALTIVTVLRLVDVSVLIGVVLSILGIGAHVSGVQTGVPLSQSSAVPTSEKAA
jgi:uncharacterized membrane protein